MTGFCWFEKISLQGFRIFGKILIFAVAKRDVAQPGSVLAWGASGRWFESSHPDKKKEQFKPLFNFL